MNEIIQLKPCITVVVCTYNRSSLLKLCLESLASQSASPENFEVLIVDNNSKDDTQSVISEYCERYTNFRSIIENKQGLSHSRNLGMNESIGKYTAYIDDDAKAFPDWIEKMLDSIDRYPEIMVFGGPYFGYALSDLPDWLPDGYGTATLGSKDKRVNIGREWINGSNMVFKTRLLKEFGGFNLDLGMSGKNIGYGEETRLLNELNSAGYEVHYIADLKVYHLIADYKLSIKWNLKASYASGRNHSKTFKVEHGILYRVKVLLYAISISVFKIFIPRKDSFKKRLFFSACQISYLVGALVERLYK